MVQQHQQKTNNKFELPSIVVPHPLTTASSPFFSGAKDGSGRQAGPTSSLKVNDCFNFRIIAETFQPWNFQPQCLTPDFSNQNFITMNSSILQWVDIFWKQTLSLNFESDSCLLFTKIKFSTFLAYRWWQRPILYCLKSVGLKNQMS